MADFLLELFSEEIPARMQKRARADLERLFAAQLAEMGLEAGDIRTFSTPRRLALIAEGLPGQTKAVSEETKGPPEAAPEQAVEGFCRKVGLSRDQLEVRDVKGRATYFAVVDKPGQPTGELLGPAIEAVVRDFPWPKSMRWGPASTSTESLRWVRPLHRIVAMLGEDVVQVDVDGVACGPASLGHRFHHPGEITFAGASDYAEKLRMAHVLVDHEEREQIVRDGAKKAAEEAGYALVEDEGLVEENAGLTEWPAPLLGRFDEDFLDVPEEVIQLTARTDQKYFVMRDGKGNLAPAFVFTANIDSKEPDAVVEGNQRVLAARLADARFFWENDLKVPLEEQAKKLDDIVFHEKLGTVADKVERVAKLARWLAEEKIVDADPDQVERAARLAKADLVTGMVGEFPELQGVIGGYLARAQGEDDAVADAVRDHYKPVGQGDDVPSEAVTVAVSLADKLDNLTSFFAEGEGWNRPTGSRDPMALRRAAIGAIRIIDTNGLHFSLNAVSRVLFESLLSRIDQPKSQEPLVGYFVVDLDDANINNMEGVDEPVRVSKAQNLSGNENVPVEWAPAAYEDGQVVDPTYVYYGISLFPYVKVWNDLLDFFADRLKVQQKEAGVRHDLIDAVFALGGEDDLVRLLARVKALQSFMETEAGADLLAAYKRASNILKKEGFDGEGDIPGEVEQTGEEDPLALVGESAGFDKAVAEWDHDELQGEEKELADALVTTGPVVTQALGDEDFTAAMEALASLRAPIDDFFETVTVNADEAAVRERRLGLLARFRSLVDAVADFSKIEG